MFDEGDIDPLRIVYGKLLHSHYCCSILVNSMMMLLRMTEKPEKGHLLKGHPMIWQDYPDGHSKETMYDRFVTNSVELMATLPLPEFYSESDPPISPVESLSKTMEISEQPLTITLSVLLMKNHDDELTLTVHDISDRWHLLSSEEDPDKPPPKIKTKHI